MTREESEATCLGRLVSLYTHARVSQVANVLLIYYLVYYTTQFRRVVGEQTLLAPSASRLLLRYDTAIKPVLRRSKHRY
jgi:hypothetical protein